MKRISFLQSLVFAAFLINSAGLMPAAQANTPGLPNPGTMVDLSPAYVPVLIKGLKVHPENPLLFDFILDTGGSGLRTNSPQFKVESEKLIKYFLASLTIQEDDLWANLSPYEKNRIIPTELGKTELGRDMLAQDYILKQLTASLIYPDKPLGKEFWNRIYAKAQQAYGTAKVPVNTFNKVWIVADKAKILERNNTAYVVGTHLKVMLEEDYRALQKNSTTSQGHDKAHAVTSQLVREIIIPELEKEVNQGQSFAPLRQIFHSMILATWFKLVLKDALLNKVYSNKEKTGGILFNDPAAKEKIYEQYLQAYKKGAFNYIKEEKDMVSKRPILRKYFSGGLARDLGIPKILDRAVMVTSEELDSSGDLAMATVNMAKKGADAAMNAGPVNAYEDFYKRFGAMDRPAEETRITQKTVNSFSLKFLTSNAEMLPPSQRRLNETWGAHNEPYGVTEVYFVPQGETQRRMAAFQKELKGLFGNKVYLVDADKLHLTVQGLEQQWDDQSTGTKKPLALHSGLDQIDLNKGAILTVREKARSIETSVVRMQVARLNFNPEAGIFWELRPYLEDPTNDPIKERRKAWGLPESRPPHITAAYFTQEFTPEEERDLRALLAKYSDVSYFGDIEVDNVQIIGYSNFAFNASAYDQGYIVLESVLFGDDFEDKAMSANARTRTARTVIPPGGVDLNAKNMSLGISKNGAGMEIKLDPVMITEFQRGDFSGIVPVIIRITPISNALQILGLRDGSANPL